MSSSTSAIKKKHFIIIGIKMCLEFKYDSYFTINQRTYGYSAFHSDMLEGKKLRVVA